MDGQGDVHARAEELLRANDHAGVAALLSPWLEEHPDDDRAWGRLAYAYFEQAEWVKAEHACRQVVRITPGNPRWWANVGTALRKQDRFDDARAAQAEALAIDPNCRSARRELRKIQRDGFDAGEPQPARRPPVERRLFWHDLWHSRATQIVTILMAALLICGPLFLFYESYVAPDPSGKPKQAAPARQTPPQSAPPRRVSVAQETPEDIALRRAQVERLASESRERVRQEEAAREAYVLEQYYMRHREAAERDAVAAIRYWWYWAGRMEVGRREWYVSYRLGYPRYVFWEEGLEHWYYGEGFAIFVFRAGRLRKTLVSGEGDSTAAKLFQACPNGGLHTPGKIDADRRLHCGKCGEYL